MIRYCAGKIIEDEEALAVTSGLITKALTLSSMILTSKNEGATHLFRPKRLSSSKICFWLRSKRSNRVNSSRSWALRLALIISDVT